MIPNFTLVVEAAVFLLFIGFSVRFIWPPLVRAMETRQKQVAEGLAEAERGRSSLADAQKQTDAILREARSRAQELVSAAEKIAHERVEESKSAAKAESERILAAARAQIDQEVQSAKQQLREQVAALAVTGAEKILQREVDARAHAQMLDQLKAQI
ncbi:MAG TPA: F0F1 ATP synthase subunit B [Usitatibacter sp.]|jgi:F-type H+-transporting ATPase subunit b|nr:F0F1 ATP synthase subunit B [Usitatibacter sp.]